MADVTPPASSADVAVAAAFVLAVAVLARCCVHRVVWVARYMLKWSVAWTAVYACMLALDHSNSYWLVKAFLEESIGVPAGTAAESLLGGVARTVSSVFALTSGGGARTPDAGL